MSIAVPLRNMWFLNLCIFFTSTFVEIKPAQQNVSAFDACQSGDFWMRQRKSAIALGAATIVKSRLRIFFADLKSSSVAQE